ncbi:hypothetical protein EDC94DRAFT_635717 [Helicostylum pulchrum]|nr:hypothetical protein EDC94DRAFT_635717 [Helicostylum pulchrum]
MCLPDQIWTRGNVLCYKNAVKNTPSCDDDETVVFDFLENIFRATFAFHTTNVDIEDGETTFNSLFIYPFIEAVTAFVANTSMAKQLKSFEFYDEESHTYLADGLFKLYGLKGLGILLLETSGCFGNTDRVKHSFDHHKGLFGSLSMLKQISDSFHKASVDTFSKIKVLFVHAAVSIRLWSLRYEPQGPVFDLWLETTLKIKPDINDKLESLPDYLNFFWVMKCLLAESIQLIEELKEEHNNFLCNNLLNQAASSSHSLSSIINPSILKLTEEEDRAGLHKVGPFYYELSST